MSTWEQLTRLKQMTLFHMRQFLTFPYFVQLMLVATIVSAIIQRLAVSAWGADPYASFVRTGLIGTWATITAAGGIIRFEKFKGTLIYFFSARIGAIQPLMALILSIACSGILSFLIALGLWVIPGPASITIQYDAAFLALFIFGLTIIWIAGMGVSMVIASLFVLSDNAPAFEALLLIPLYMVSGVFGVPALSHPILEQLLLVVSPTMRISHLLMAPQAVTLLGLVCSLFTAAMWFLLGIVLLRTVSKKLSTATLSSLTI
ncbi:multidrug ABC transporter permease [Corynebacterium ulcerans]|nr:hypothetical protein [Corynebacterium ulcerans]AEG83264.1 antibiotic transport system permease protein [Corynebacterium ulcerans BR-AD22]NOL57807.1 multidrug ABC transporter permease [Corynebacterium ulcerans]NOM02077.1 multidrug ABC transporter permease [Corynebacterium ulcerans]